MIRAHLIHLFKKKEGVVSCGVKVNSIVECTYPKVHLFTHLILLVVFGRRKKKNDRGKDNRKDNGKDNGKDNRKDNGKDSKKKKTTI